MTSNNYKTTEIIRILISYLNFIYLNYSKCKFCKHSHSFLRRYSHFSICATCVTSGRQQEPLHMQCRVVRGAGRSANLRAGPRAARGCGPSFIIGPRTLRAEFCCCGPLARNRPAVGPHNTY